jgi:ATP-dependent DNA helicase 2 subunit 2
MKVFVFLLSIIVLVLCELDERKSIVYDKKTPDVFYCPINHHDNIDEMLVRSRPLHKLCEYNGESLPEGYRSDCYGDVDESPFACKEKRRIMKRRYPPGMEVLLKYESVPRWKRAEMWHK